jgi:hypothetical protein
MIQKGVKYFNIFNITLHTFDLIFNTIGIILFVYFYDPSVTYAKVTFFGLITPLRVLIVKFFSNNLKVIYKYSVELRSMIKVIRHSCKSLFVVILFLLILIYCVKILNFL